MLQSVAISIAEAFPSTSKSRSCKDVAVKLLSLEAFDQR
jgi:hypothetical protein